MCVIGLGNIGLPTACVLATSGYEVTGVDVDDQVVSRLQSGQVPLLEPNLSNLFLKAVEQKTLKISKTATFADIHLIVVPTFLTFTKQPELSCVYAAIEAIKPYLRADDLILIESTCPIGTTEKIAQNVRAKCPGVFVAYCPERVLPGNILYELIHNDRVVGGSDPLSTVHAVNFYRSFVKGAALATDARTAEAVKLAENSYRDINIAYANELSMIADQMNVDVHEVIRLANQHPRVQILKPGPGVGGCCIPTNPWFLASSSPTLALLTLKAREVNMQKTDWAIQKIKATILEKKASLIACLGLTYKANVPDIRESPALAIVQSLEKEIQVMRVDPYVAGTTPLYDALATAEIVVGLVAHDPFLNIPQNCLHGKTVLDFGGIF